MAKKNVYVTIAVAVVTVCILISLRYVEGFNVRAEECPIGFFCPITTGTGSASAPKRCSSGVFGATRENRDHTCDGPCNPGCWCGEGSTSACQNICPAGFYCPKGTGGHANSNAQVKITPCAPGFYCPPGSSVPRPCPEGKICPAQTGSI